MWPNVKHRCESQMCTYVIHICITDVNVKFRRPHLPRFVQNLIFLLHILKIWVEMCRDVQKYQEKILYFKANVTFTFPQMCKFLCCNGETVQCNRVLRYEPIFNELLHIHNTLLVSNNLLKQEDRAQICKSQTIHKSRSR